VALNPGSQRVVTLRAAIARMGFNMARSATIAFAMSQMRRAEAWRGLEAQFREIWERSARIAAIAYALARHGNRQDADQALLAGMLSAVGRLFVLTRVRAFPALMADLPMRREIEQVWQARAARALLSSWQLDEAVLSAASDFEQSTTGEGAATLSDVLLAACHLAAVQDLSALSAAAFLEAAPFRRLGLDDVASAAVLEASATETASLRAALGD
jgi:HD-like signal output (HDOD) protein